jgi:peptide deformylase
MEVVIYPDPILRRGGQPVSRFDPSLRELADRMFEAMYAEGGVGLAAPQVAVEKKLLVLNPSGDRQKPAEQLVLLNPKITRKKGREWGEEGCLSFPDIRGEVERWVTITVSFQDLDGKEQTLEASGWLARIIQHELDHLDGVLFTDRLSAADRLRVRPLLAELEDRYRARRPA